MRATWRLNKNPAIRGAENRVHRHVVAATNGRTMLEFLRNGYCFAAEMWRHNRIAVAKGNTRRFLNQMHIIATHARHRA